MPAPGLVRPTTSPAIAAPPIRVALTPSLSSAFALCERLGADGLRDDSRRGGKEEGEGHSAERREHDQLPDLGLPGEQQHGGHGLNRAVDEVRRDHDPMAWEAVGPDPADQHEDHERDRLRGQDVPEVGLRAGQVEDGERERDVVNALPATEIVLPKKRSRNSRSRSGASDAFRSFPLGTRPAVRASRPRRRSRRGGSGGRGRRGRGRGRIRGICVAPAPTSACTHSTQRTGLAICSTSAACRDSASSTSAPREFEATGTRGSDQATSRTASAI